ncbi:MAG: serine--pyruvate aminotransferase [Candidatus Binatia bacterium]|nr:MAG: serine--pyruvate aminotransferase [Candidatus Binatia bacterium]
MQVGELKPSDRLLLGPGPSNVHPRVLRALAAPLVGHLDPEFLRVMDETKAMLRAVFRTRNELTLPVSGTGSAGMETCFVNLVEDGDEVVVGVNGLFGERMCDVARRCGASVVRVEVPWGQVLDPEEVRKTLGRCRRPKLLAVVHAETSTGAWQPLEELGRLAREREALFLVDTVTSLGGVPVELDAWGIDVSYSGTQKCLSCPPGLSPVSFGPRAVEALRRRRKPVASWYLDLGLIEKYWGEERVYHHTAPVSMNYALREALRIVLEEGLEARFERHRKNHEALGAGLDALGLRWAAAEGHRLPVLNSVFVPDGVDEAGVRRRLLERYGIEIGAGLGPWKGKVWRIGLMGESSKPGNVLFFLSAFEEVLAASGHRTERGAAVAAAGKVYAR